MRYAIYYTPPEDDPLTRLAQTWLGRNAFTGETLAPRLVGTLPAAEIAYQTAAARRYGFHATLKAPFQLAEGEDERELTAALAAFCGQMKPFCGPRLVLRRLDGFLALVPEEPSARLDELARDVVVAFERFRAPLTETELARRNPDALSPRQLKNLHQWGYPYVFEEFRFHMTLTGRVADADAPRIMRAIEEHFGPVLEEPLEVGSLALFVEPEPGAPFAVHSFHEFGRLPERKSA
jgi:putative phosphonate metabolism protein